MIKSNGYANSSVTVPAGPAGTITLVYNQRFASIRNAIALPSATVPNATFLNGKLDLLINELKKRFDYIIFDTPPIGLLSDALVLMKQSDINIFVMKAGVSKRDYIDIAHQLVEKNEIKHMSIVLNGVSSKNIPSGYGAGYYS
jgi:Mrp family chromosome partitioning ATPase